MSIVRERPYGNFLSLIEAVEAIGRTIVISDKEIYRHHSLNPPKDANNFETKIGLAVVDRMLRQAHAADRLFELLNREPEFPPSWYELKRGRMFRDDSVGREGCEILAQWANQMTPTRGNSSGKWGSVNTAALSAEPSFAAPRGMSLGFDVDKFIQFLDSNGIPHSLGAPKDEGPIEASPPKAPTETLAASADDDGAHTRGLGSNNLLFMACELLLLAAESDGFPLLLIEEPEAHRASASQGSCLRLMPRRGGR
jgi:hypothetical protein